MSTESACPRVDVSRRPSSEGSRALAPVGLLAALRSLGQCTRCRERSAGRRARHRRPPPPPRRPRVHAATASGVRRNGQSAAATGRFIRRDGTTIRCGYAEAARHPRSVPRHAPTTRLPRRPQAALRVRSPPRSPGSGRRRRARRARRSRSSSRSRAPRAPAAGPRGARPVCRGSALWSPCPAPTELGQTTELSRSSSPALDDAPDAPADQGLRVIGRPDRAIPAARRAPRASAVVAVRLRQGPRNRPSTGSSCTPASARRSPSPFFSSGRRGMPRYGQGSRSPMSSTCSSSPPSSSRRV